MKDIQNKQDIEVLVDKFYQKVKADPLIKHFFLEVVHLSWDKHIPVIVSFWESILLGTGDYKGNPMAAHLELSKLAALERKHFEKWLGLWSETVGENFAGPKSEEAVSRANAIAEMMMYKINPPK